MSLEIPIKYVREQTEGKEFKQIKVAQLIDLHVTCERMTGFILLLFINFNKFQLTLIDFN